MHPIVITSALLVLALAASPAAAQGSPDVPSPESVVWRVDARWAASPSAVAHKSSALRWSPLTGTIPVAQEAPPSYERILLGSALGTAAGAAVGTGVALLVYSSQTGEAYLGPLPELSVIGIPITALGTAVGTYIGARGEASPWTVGAAAVIGVGLGLGAGVLVGSTLGPGAGEYAGGTIGAVIGITVPATVVWATTR